VSGQSGPWVNEKYRGAVEVLNDPFVFRWTVNESGYEWADGEDGKVRLFPRYVPGAGGVWRYTPEPGLFREFAALNPTRDAIRDFAGKYGDLFDQWDLAHTRVKNGRWAGGTSLDRWKAKIGDMRDLVDIWGQIQDERRHGELKKMIVRTENEICYKRGPADVTIARDSELSRFNPRDVLLPARCALQLEINKRLADTETPTLTVPRLALTPDNHQRIVFGPCNLLAEMWVRFAQVVAGEFNLKQCAVCHKYFQVGPGGRRQHTVTCGPKCRKQKSRDPA
jgi:hypothetical protein